MCCKEEKSMKVYVNDREIKNFSSVEFIRDNDAYYTIHVKIYIDEKNKLEFNTHKYKIDIENNKYWFYVIWL